MFQYSPTLLFTCAILSLLSAIGAVMTGTLYLFAHQVVLSIWAFALVPIFIWITIKLVQHARILVETRKGMNRSQAGLNRNDK